MPRGPYVCHRLLAAGLTVLLCGPVARPQSPAPRKTPQSPPAAANPANDKRARQEYAAGAHAEQVGDWAAAFQGYAQAATDSPANPEYRLRRELARFRLVEQHVDRAERAAVSGELGQAQQELRQALALDPGYAVARERLQQLEALAQRLPVGLSTAVQGDVQLTPQPGTRKLDYRGDAQGAYEEVARQFGITATFDVDFHPRQVRFRVDDVDFWTAMRVLSELTNTFWRAVTPHLFLVAENTPQKQRDYALAVLRSVILPESETPDQMTETFRLVREIAGIQRTQLDLASRTLTMRATPRDIDLALDLIQESEQAPGELMLEIDVLEVDLNAARRLGLTPPSSGKVFTISPLDIQQAQQSIQGLLQVIAQLFGQPSSLAGLAPGQVGALLGAGQLSFGSLIPPLLAFGGGQSTFLATLPGAAADFSESLSLLRHGRRVLLRAEDGQPATLFVGDRVPVSLGLLSPSLGTAQFVPQFSTGSFPITTLSTGKGPSAVALGDFKDDGHLDLAVANQAANTVSVILNQGSGNFANKVDYATGAGPTAVVSGDFNGDKKFDLAVANQDQSDHTLTILLANPTGDGTFKPAASPPTVGQAPVALLAADFNNDGKLDLAVVNKGSNSVSILLGNGDGTFQPKMDFATGKTPVALAAADFDNDGNLDLAVVNQADNTVTILLGDGHGSFTAQANPPATGNSPAGIVAADFNGDGRPDLAIVNRSDSTVSILFGNGDGTFQAKTDFPTGKGPVAVAAGDFNLDGRPDLAVTNQTDNTVSVLINNGSGGFGFKLDLPVGNSPSAVAIGDLNGDGRPDVAVTNQTDGTVSAVFNNTVFATGQSVGQTAYPSAEYEDLGLKVKATPRLHSDHEVTLQMEIEIRSLANTQLNGVPVISNRTIDQTVRLREDESTALAGILQPSEMRALTGWPWFAQGGRHDAQRQDAELLILVTPRLLRLAPRLDRSFYAGHGAGTAAGPAGLSQRAEPIPH